MSPYGRQSWWEHLGPLRPRQGERFLIMYLPSRPVVSITALAGLSVLVVSASSGALRVEAHVVYDPATSTMGGRVVTSAPFRGERRERSLRPRSCRWLLEKFFAGWLDAAILANVGALL